MRNENGQWYRSWQPDADPRAQHTALAHDLAFVVDAMTRMYELTADHDYLSIARDTAQQLIDFYWDESHGGVFTVSSNGEQLVVRQKDLMDNATPSANSVTSLAFLRLAAITGDDALAQRAQMILRLLGRVSASAPSAFCHAMMAATIAHEGTTEIVIPGHQPEWLSIVREKWRPTTVIAWGEPTGSPLWSGRDAGQAYVCRNYTCQLPAQTSEELRDRLATN